MAKEVMELQMEGVLCDSGLGGWGTGDDGHDRPVNPETQRFER